MESEYPAQALQGLERCGEDPSGVYMGLRRLQQAVGQHPERAGAEVVHRVGELLRSPRLGAHSKAFFVFREGTQILAELLRFGGHERRRHALAALQHHVFAGQESSRQAAAEALGGLPLQINGPALPGTAEVPQRSVSLEALPLGPLRRVGGWQWAGRSVWAPVSDGRICVCKCLRAGENPHTLAQEASWLTWTAANFPEQFGEYALLFPQQAPLVRLALSETAAEQAGCSSVPISLVFYAPQQYFAYLNAPWRGCYLLDRCGQGLQRCAYELGLLAGAGVLHTDPIALYHNHIQHWRRNDGGRYQWHRGGRLDQWLASCRYPNLGVAGIRDFEHLTAFSGGGREVYHGIGDHFLSLVLVAGSCFRFQSPTRVGLDPHGHPLDTRDLFDFRRLAQWLEDCFFAYYQGFTRNIPWSGSCPIAVRTVAAQLVDAFGLDQHMLEVLRE
ncbi:MAG: SidJ-related pseudokinase, partial [Thermodesulfobacteriota bacterium]